MDEDAGPPNRELYALLHISPQASDEEIRRAYRQWAQVYHPDKYKAPQMKDIASENFHRICEAYEILSDKNKRQIYDIYGMEGLKSGLELGAKLNRVEEIKEEIERLKRKEAQEKALNHFRPSGSILASLSLPQYLEGDGVMKGMAMASEVRSHISKRNAISISGNLSVRGNSGGGAATAVLEHQISSAASIDFVASAGLRSLIGVQSSRNLSRHSTATVGVARSLRDGSITLSNAWTRQLSEASSGDIQLVLGPESFVSVGWKKQDEKVSASGELKFGTSSFGASAHYTHRLSSKSSGCVSGRFGSTNLEFEVGVARRISDFSTLLMSYTIGIEGVSWKFELHRGGQKLIIPVLLSGHLKAGFAAGAFFIPTSFYFLLKKYIFKPYYLRLEKRKALENREKTSAQVKEARTAADKAQQLLRDVANRKRNKQQEAGGLVVTNAVYGSCKALKKQDETSNLNDVLASQVIDVTSPLNFLVNDSGELKLHKGIKKSGIMGFCDCCPGEPKQLYVEYMYKGNRYEVVVDDYEELRLPQEELMI